MWIPHYFYLKEYNDCVLFSYKLIALDIIVQMDINMYKSKIIVMGWSYSI